MKYLYIIYFVVGLTLTCFLQAEVKLEAGVILGREEIKALGQEAVKEITAIYLEDGIEAALIKADELHADLVQVPVEFMAPELRSSPRRLVSALTIEMWREAQVRTGNDDSYWALEVFKWLDHKRELDWIENHGHSESRKKRKRIGPLVASLYHHMCALGRLGEANLLVQEMQQSLTEEGLNLMTDELEDLGAWRTEIPELRIRPFPIKRTIVGHRKVYYSFAYFQTMSDVSHFFLIQGNWQRAGELSIWIRKYANAYDADYPDAKGSKGFDTRENYSKNTNRLAYILDINGNPEAALELLDECIARNYYDYKGRSRDYAMMYREALLLKLGRSDPESVERAEAIFNRFRDNEFSWMSGTAMLGSRYADLLYHHGRPVEAWEFLLALEADLHENAATARNTLRRRKVTWAIREQRYEEAELWLHECLDHARNKGLKLEEPSLYELYAELQAARSDYTSAARLTKEAQRLYKSIRLEHAINRTEVDLAYYQERASNISATTVADSLQTKPTDLQPISMTSVALVGKPALGRFALSNPNSASASGVLNIEGFVGDLEFDAEGGVYTISVLDTEVKRLSQQVTVGPNEQILVAFRADDPAVVEQSVKLTWIPDGYAAQNREWSYSVSEVAVSSSFINASFVKDSPFYLVPIFHTLQRSSVDEASISNFRFVASAPTRVEVYSSDTGQLIYIDANGDGDLMGSGDQLIEDSNRDGFADITHLAQQDSFEIEVYFKADARSKHSTMQLSLELEVNGEWETQCINEISFSK